uniref:Uncharacterized protein n=1 Tax=Anguilla anguilla TaxID=7936 RepID=A0A0E9TV19_ANGAN
MWRYDFKLKSNSENRKTEN